MGDQVYKGWLLQPVDADMRRGHLHLRVSLKTGMAPARSDGQATLKTLLLERLGMSEESMAKVMSAVSQVRVLSSKAGPGALIAPAMSLMLLLHPLRPAHTVWTAEVTEV